MLANNKMLTYISVDDNMVGPDGVTALANDKSLTDLGVGGNQLDNGSLNALGNAYNLEGLDVSYSLIDYSAIAAFNNLPKLTYLDISGIGGGDAYAEVLSQNAHLRALSMRDTRLSYYGATELAKMPNLDSYFIK